MVIKAKSDPHESGVYQSLAQVPLPILLDLSAVGIRPDSEWLLELAQSPLYRFHFPAGFLRAILEASVAELLTIFRDYKLEMSDTEAESLKLAISDFPEGIKQYKIPADEGPEASPLRIALQALTREMWPDLRQEVVTYLVQGYMEVIHALEVGTAHSKLWRQVLLYVGKTRTLGNRTIDVLRSVGRTTRNAVYDLGTALGQALRPYLEAKREYLQEFRKSILHPDSLLRQGLTIGFAIAFIGPWNPVALGVWGAVETVIFLIDGLSRPWRWVRRRR